MKSGLRTLGILTDLRNRPRHARPSPVRLGFPFRSLPTIFQIGMQPIFDFFRAQPVAVYGPAVAIILFIVVKSLLKVIGDGFGNSAPADFPYERAGIWRLGRVTGSLRRCAWQI